MMNVTIKQLISLLLLTATMAIILALMPEHPAGSDQALPTTDLAGKITE